MRSLRARLLLVTSVLLAGALAIVGVILDESVRAALDEEQRELLDSKIIMLLAVAEPSQEQSLTFPPDLPEQRFNTPGSGLYAKVRDRSGAFLWRSESALGLTFDPDTPLPAPGEQVYVRQQTSNGDTLLTVTLGVVWTFDDDTERYFALSAAESERAIIAPLERFRGQMFAAFALVAIALLIGMGLVLSWLLRPLGQIAGEISAVESGHRAALSDEYPSELSGVARNLNALMRSEQRRTERYQQTLANLGDDEAAQPVHSQLQRMEQIVRYQLSRSAITTGRTVGKTRVPVFDEVSQMLGALDKVYRSKNVRGEIEMPADLVFQGDKGDLVEILGNLLDNAYKWCRQRVLIVGLEDAGLNLVIEDDGPGVPADAVAAALRRGTRLDETVPGSGIGLAVVAELVAQYGGKLEIRRSDLGGAAVHLNFPRS